MEPFETFEHWGVKVELHQDTDAGDPYENMDQASELLSFDRLHREFGFGERFPVPAERDLPVLARWLTLFGGYAVAIPFTFEDYGSSGYQARLVGVDSGRAAGFVVVKREKVAEEWNDHPEHGTALERAEACARAEFATWKAWLEGDVCGYVVEGGDPDSGWGFYGPGGDDEARREARSVAEEAAFDREKRRLTERMYALDPDANPAALTWASFYLAHAGEDAEVRATLRSGDKVRVLREEPPAMAGKRGYVVRYKDGLEAVVYEDALTYLHTAEREGVPA